uniref:Uncharacterized protein n=1 Tax=Rhizophora mucronata TaxID=61149 RepID=A0A2P2JIT1_RHIMU
MILCESEV